MQINKQTLRKIEDVRQKYQDALLAKGNVVGLGIGEKITNGQQTGKPALVVFVETKAPRTTLTSANLVEPVIEGVETDVVEIGTPELLANTARLRPAIGGISIGHVNISAGTFGCLLRSEADGQLYILSNNHVLADSNAGQFGDAIIQPGDADLGMDPVDRIATLYRYPAVSPTSDNLVDCALARPVNANDVRAVILDAWTDVKLIPGWFGAQNQGGDVALAVITGEGQLDLVVFHIDNPSGENHGYYRIGWNLDANGDVTGGWSNVKAVPGWFGAQDQGAGIAIADINGNGRPELFIFHLDNPRGENHGYYRIGWDLDANGDVANWSNPTPIPGWFGAQNQGGGIAIADFTGSGRPEMVIYHIDNPSGENICYYRIGRDVRTNGTVTSWSEVRQVSGWAGSQDQGGGIAAGDINGDGTAELVSFHIDNPSGENHGYYRIAFNLGRSGDFISGLLGRSVAGFGLRVWKSGRTTELNNGSVTTVSSTVNIFGFGQFVDQLTISPIVRPGDSGSALVNAQNHVVGLIFAAARKSDGTYTAGFANRIEHVLEALRWSDVKAVPGWFGSQNQGADIAVADVNRNGQPDLVVFHIDNPGGENHGYYRIGWNLDGNGDVRGGWSDIKSVPGWFGAEDQGAGIAIASISRGRTPDLVVFHIDNPGGENHGYYRIGWNLDNNGDVTGGWSDVIAVPGWFGAQDQGAGIAIADINGNGRPDLVVFHVDNPGGENHGYYRIGWNLNTNGDVTGGWSDVIAVPGWFGAQDQGAGIAIADITGNGRPDLVVFHVDNPGGENHGYYRIGWNLDDSGHVTGGWSNIIAVPGWFGAQDQGAGIALTDLTRNNRPDLVVFHVDNPGGENHGYYRVAFDLMPTGIPARWTVA